MARQLIIRRWKNTDDRTGKAAILPIPCSKENHGLPGNAGEVFPEREWLPLLQLGKNWPSSCDRGFFIARRQKGVNVSGEDKNKQPMRQEVTDEAIFKVTKEIVVKFIEVGRLTPSSFDQTFERVYRAIERTVRSK